MAVPLPVPAFTILKSKRRYCRRNFFKGHPKRRAKAKMQFEADVDILKIK
jgi:hypothetical protein